MALLDVDPGHRADLDTFDLHRVVDPQAGGVVELGLITRPVGEEGRVAHHRDQPTEDEEAHHGVDPELEDHPTVGANGSAEAFEEAPHAGAPVASNSSSSPDRPWSAATWGEPSRP